MILPEGKFGVIYADPPWRFATWSDKGRNRCPDDKKWGQGKNNDPSRHYNTMSFDEIKALPVADVAARDSALFLWAVDSMLPQALDTGAAWGFEYKTVAFYWAKKRRVGSTRGRAFDDDEKAQFPMGTGYWTRSNPEQCLLFTRGHPKRVARNIRKLVLSPRREHSQKPDEVYDRIQALVAGPYLELFARQQWPGWTAWGNQTDKFEAPGSPSLSPPVPLRPAGDNPDLPLRESRDGRPEGRGTDGQAESRDEPARAAAGPALATARG